MRRLRTALALAALAACVGACGSSPADSATSERPQSRTAPAAVTPSPGRRAPRARASGTADRVAARLATVVPAGGRDGAAVAPLAGGPVRVVGARVPTRAWSTIKLPLIATVLRARRAGELPGGTTVPAAEREAILRGIIASDNDAARTLYGELVSRFGSDAEATGRIEQTLRLSGDATTQVNARFTRPEFSNIGQTSWALRDMASFYRALAGGDVVPARERRVLLGAMAAVDANQQWGAWGARWPSAAMPMVKGGWGPSVTGGYDVLQAAIIPGPDGLVLTVATVAPSFPAGQARLGTLARAAAAAARERPRAQR